MTPEEELICAPCNRDLFRAWKDGDITWDEAIFLAHRVEFHFRIRAFPPFLIRAALILYDFINEPPGAAAPIQAARRSTTRT